MLVHATLTRPIIKTASRKTPSVPVTAASGDLLKAQENEDGDVVLRAPTTSSTTTTTTNVPLEMRPTNVLDNFEVPVDEDMLLIADEDGFGTTTTTMTKVPPMGPSSENANPNKGGRSVNRPKSKRRLSYGGPRSLHPEKNVDLLMTQISDKEMQIAALQHELEMLRLATNDLPKVVVIKPVNAVHLKNVTSEKKGKLRDKFGPLPCSAHGQVCETCYQVVVAPKWARMLGIPQTAQEADAERKRTKRLCKKQGWGSKIRQLMKRNVKTVLEVEDEVDQIVNCTIINDADQV